MICKWKEIMLYVFSSSILFLSFQFNAFNTVNDQRFQTYDIGSEALVIGRLVNSRENGLFSSGGQLGIYKELPGERNTIQDQLYLKKIEGGEYEAYISSIGFQGFFFSLLDKLFDKFNLIDLEKRIDLFHALTSLLLVFALSSIVLLVSFEIGFVSALLVLGTIVYSQWLVLGAKNLYWITGLFFMPMIIIWIAHKYEELKFKFYLKLTLAVLCVFLFMKLSAGYEYVSSILLSTFVPIVYFSVKNRWSFKKFLKRFVYIGVTGLFAFLITFSTHIIQRSFVANTEIIYTLNTEISKVKTRLHTKEGTFVQSEWNLAAAASVKDVLNMYLDSEAINFQNFFIKKFLTKITYKNLIFIFLIFSVFVLIQNKYSKNIAFNKRKLIALIVVTWFSILAPLSWYVLAKVHSYVHLFLNNVLWHLPFTIFGSSLVSFIVYLLFKDLYKFNKYVFYTLLYGILFLVLSLNVLNIIQSKKLIPENIIDINWQNGVLKDSNNIFIVSVENSLSSQIKIGYYLQFNSGIRRIINVKQNGPYLNITLDGEKLDPIRDGYPNEIKIINKGEI